MENDRIYRLLADLDKARRRLTTEELSLLYELAEHRDATVRSNVAALLCDHYEVRSEAVLQRLTYDSDAYVRTDAVDSLCIGRTEATLQRLMLLAEHDPMYTVRGYAVHSLYDVFLNIQGDSDQILQSIIGLLTPLLDRESHKWVRSCYHCVLYLCGEKEYLQDLLDALEDDDYYVKYSALNAFEDILNEENEADIEDALQYCLPFETDDNLCGKIEDLLLYIDEYKTESL